MILLYSYVFSEVSIQRRWIETSEAYGTAYLELTANRLATGESPAFDPVGSEVRFEFDRTIVPAEENPDSDDRRELAFIAGGLSFLHGDDVVASFDVGDPTNEPLFLDGAYGAESSGDRSWRWHGTSGSPPL